MTAKYLVSYGRGQELKPPFLSFKTALEAAVVLDQAGKVNVSVINTDAIDVCPDQGCKSCSRDGLTDQEREALAEAGLG